MKYIVTVAGRELEVDVDGERVTVGGRTMPASLGRVAGTPLRPLSVDGRPETLVMQPSGRGQWSVGVGGERWDIEVVDERTRHIRSLTGGADRQRGAGALRAPMPGLVIRILVEPGQAVARGGGLVVLEAMKMENELKAAADGTVKTVRVGTGEPVEKGQVLVEFEWVPLVGSLEVLEGVHSPELGNRRDVLVYLPPSYRESGRSYPILYMQDGQNLFDPSTSFAGEWGVGRAMNSAARRGIEAIVVGVPNMGPERLNEYAPWPDPEAGGGGKGDAYAAFLVRTLKPIVDERFRTERGREHTGVVGSSMGGLISLVALLRHPDAFGAAGVLSPSLWFAGGAIFSEVERSPFVPARIYLDIGVQEGPRHVGNARRMRDLLLRKGYRLGADLRWLESRSGRHDERSWGRRFARALPFLLGWP